MDSEMKRLLRNSLFAFALKAYAAINEGRRLDPEPYLELLAEQLQQFARRKKRRLAISMPPRHAKTFLGSICLVAYILMHEPAARIMVLSYSTDLAEEIAFYIRKIMQSDFYREITSTRIAKNRAKVNDFATTAGGRVRAVSIEGGVTGKGGDFLIIDDAVEIKDHDNPKRLRRANALFDGEIRTRLDNPKTGCILIIAHRIAEDDLVGHVLQERGWWHLKLPLIAPRARTYKFSDGRAWHRKKDELLRPRAMTAAQLAQLRASRTKPGFETLQQQNPGGEDRLRIRPDHFPCFAPKTAAIATLPLVLSIDPGQRGGPSNSCSVLHAWAIDGGTFLLCDEWREQAPYRDLRQATYRFIRTYRPSAILIEATGQGPALSSDIRPQNGMEIVQLLPADNKVDRLRRHRRIIRAGSVHLPEDAPWRDDFLTELTLFPFGAFDDRVDALTQFLDWIAANPNPKVRPSRALVQGVNSRGVPLSNLPRTPITAIPGGVLARRFSR
jgi:predicted phage terminase large subunit-like protein